MRHRVGVVLLIFVFFGLFLTGRLAKIQLLKYRQYSQQAASLHQRLIPEELVPRGDILDRNFRSITDSGTRLAAVLFPNLFSGAPGAWKKIQEILQLHTLPSIRSVSQLWIRPVILKSDLSHEEVSRIRQLNLPGLYVVPMTVRYGRDSLARHFVGHLQGNKGVMGLEKQYDGELAGGSSGSSWSLFLDARGNLVRGLSFRKVTAGQPQRKVAVRLTLDRDLQLAVEKIMDEKVAKGAVVVMDARTGALLATASRPNFHQELVYEAIEERDNSPLLNRVISNYYPGSIFKIVVAAAALEEGLVTPEEKLYCSGKYQFASGLEIPCWNKEGHGELTLAEALAYSCNPIFIEVALRLGREKLIAYAQKFGVDDEVLVGYQLDSYQSLHIGYGPGDLGNAAVGQKGVMISPLKVAKLTAVVANGGYLVEPRLVETVVDEQGRIVAASRPSKVTRVIRKATAQTLQKMLLQVTTAGTGKQAWLPRGSAGKTSSAETGQFVNGKQVINAWFTGYLPVDDPRYVITVLVEGGNYGGKVAAPVFREIGQYLLNRELD